MSAATRSQNNQTTGQRAVSWKGIAPWVLADAGVEEHDGLTYVPYLNESGSTVVCKVFGSGARAWYEPAGVELLPFGLERLPRSSWIAARSALLVTEGESDALAAREYFFEGDSRILTWHVIGLPGAGTWRPAWRTYLEPFPIVYLLGDGDEAGRKMNATVRKDIPWARPVSLPDGKDVRGVLQRDGREGLLPYLAAADVDARLAAALKLVPDVDAFFELLDAEEEGL